MNTAIILAGGKGTRMLQDIPKQFLQLGEKPVVANTIEKFSNCKDIDNIIIVCIDSYIDLMKKICEKHSLKKVTGIVSGGDTRHESILKGLTFLKNSHIKCDKILLHNANMPLVTEDNIIGCLNACVNINHIVTSVARCTGYFYQIVESSKLSDGYSLALGPDRDLIVSAKVPEAMFLTTALDLYSKKIYSKKQYESYTAGMLGIVDGYEVIPVECETTNIKITTPDDMELVKNLFLNAKGKRK